MTSGPAVARLTIVVLTHNRCAEVLETLSHLEQVAPFLPVIVVDNASSDGTVQGIRHRFKDVLLIENRSNKGAAGRNVGVRCAKTAYVAFCDDDTRWEAGALERATALLDAYPHVALISGAVLVGPQRQPDPACLPMEHSPLNSEGLPGKRLLGFMAGAAVVRVAAFRQVGGFWPPFFIGAEEDLLALDLAQAGWDLVFVPEVRTVHYPSSQRAPGRHRLVLRNAIWLALARLPLRMARPYIRDQLRQARAQGDLLWVLRAAVAGLPTALLHRRVVSPIVAAMWEQTRKFER